MKLQYWVLAIVVLQALSTAAHANDRTVSRSQFGDEWPFTVEEGTLRCSDNEVTFSTNGVQYAVNGSAKSAGYASMDTIWQPNTELIQEMADAMGMTLEEAMKEFTFKISVGPVIESGLELCK